MAGEYDLGELAGLGQISSGLFDSLFAPKGFSGINEGFNYISPEAGKAFDPQTMQPEAYGYEDWRSGPLWSGLGEGFNEGGQQQFTGSPTQQALDSYKGYTFNWTPEELGAGTLNAFDPTGIAAGTFKQKGESGFDQFMGMVAPMVAGWGFGGALSGMFGGGMTGGALGHGIASGTLSSMQGGDFGKGFLGGAIGGGLNGLAQGTPAVMGNNPSAYVPGTPGTSIAGLTGVTNPIASGMINRGAGSFLGSLASGSNGSDALKSGLTGAALSGINSAGKGVMDYYKSSFNDWLGGGSNAGVDTNTDDFAALQGSGGDMSGQTDVTPSHYNETVMGSDGLETANANYGFGGPLDSFSQSSPNQFAQSAGQPEFSLASFLGNAGGGLGRAALSNVGDLASMLYGFYNNRKQQKALGQQISSLQGLYGQNSPYAAQLRNTLNAKAAASGRRSNVAGRETQLQAMLADRNAQMAPTLMQLNQAQGGLKNNNMNMLLQGFNKLGGFQGLSNLFKPSNPYANYSMANNTSDYNTLGMEGHY